MHTKKIDFVGKRFGRLVVVSEATPYRYFSKLKKCATRQFNCVCDCGNKKVVSCSTFKRNHISCGCWGNERTRERFTKDLTGKRFGRILVLSKTSNKKCKTRCDCGVVKDIDRNSLVSGNTKSCGCFRRERASTLTFNPSLTEKDRISRMLVPRWTEVRQKIRKRDKYTCLICGTRTPPLHVHHLKSWTKFKKLRFAFDNLVTLCAYCHKEVHTIKRIALAV